MNLSYLQTYVHLCETNSFSKAAEAMFITQPAVTQQIHALEKELGVQLIERNRQGISVTDAGKRFYEYADKVVKMTDDITCELQSRASHEVTHLDVYVFNNMLNYVYDIVDRFYASNPNAIVELKSISPRDISDSEKLQSGTLYFADQGWFQDTDIRFVPAVNCPIHCFISEDNPLSAKSIISFEDLSSYTLYTPPLRKASRYTVNAVCLELLSLYPDIECCTVPNFNSGLAKARNGQGFCLAPGYLTPMIKGIISRPLNSDVRISAGFLYRGKASKIMRAFLECVL